MKEWPPNGMLSAWIMRQFESGYQGYAIDVGAQDGISVNTTYLLESHRWTVLCIEPNPQWHKRLKEIRAFVQTCAVDDRHEPAVSFHVNKEQPDAYSSLRPSHPDHPVTREGWNTIEVQTKTLEQCLAHAEFPKLDALCIDTEGTELAVLKSFDIEKWKPKVLVVECWDAKAPVDTYVREHGYEFDYRDVDNNMYVRRT